MTDIEALRARMRCDVTGNLVGTNTRMIGAPPCDCQGCRADAEITRLREDLDRVTRERDEEVARLCSAPAVEFHQHDWIPGFAAFNPDATTPPPQSRAFCVLNLGSILATVEAGHVEKAEVPYFVAESMMHEIMHALEQWAGAEFSEERIEAMLDKYRAEALTQEPTNAER